MTKLHVAFKVGTAEYIISSDHVVHLEAYAGATRVPGAPEFVAGLVQVRGKLVPVVDLRTRFGLAPGEQTIDSRVIVVKVGTRTAGLLVDSARDVLRIDEEKFEEPPEMVRDQANGFVRAVTTQANRLLFVVDVPRVIGEEIAHA
ncbi:MAG TPA: chemotaxis protein CheW [Kofleriaceae bacterium]|nr:chemotaxis protein CheW [Kofleriaceae bacterium]